MRIWSGTAYAQALSEEEVDLMIKLWRIEAMRPKKLCVGDVLKLVDFAACIREYRKQVAKSKSRLRKV